MTEQQQNILSLFNTKDPVNMEIAEETAISTGNGVWFSNWIDDKLKEEGVQQYFRWILSGAPLDYKPDKDYRIFRTFRITIPSEQDKDFLNLLDLMNIKIK